MKINYGLLVLSFTLLVMSCKTNDDLCKYYSVEIIQESANSLRAIGHGNPPYIYEWSNGVHLSEITVTQAGTYRVTVTDFNFCSNTAKFDYTPGTCDTAGVYDEEGNFYKVISIGGQCWLQSNLRSTGGFPQVKDSQEWSKITTPAWCYYRGDSSNSILYGKLYNGYAMESGKLCPKGWHIPTNDEWSTLINNLGGPSVAGIKMKSTTSLWESPSIANDSSQFGVFPAGRVQPNGSFIHRGQQAGIWTSTLSSPGGDRYLYRGFINSDSAVLVLYWPKVYGFSCRCIKN